jgi:hypothetical protein
MPDYPPVSPQVIGETETALSGLLAPLLAAAGLSFPQWVVLTLAAGTPGIAQDQLAAAVTEVRKLAPAEATRVAGELAEAGALSLSDGQVTLAPPGRAVYDQVRGQVAEITAALFDFPADDLATAGRVLAVITARANAVLAAGR